jgi:hypothetical protein
MTPQEIFDKAYIGVVKQGKKSINAVSDCAYYVGKNLRCGVGHLLSESAAKAFDSCARRDLETDIESILDAKASKYIGPWMEENRELIVDVQRAHDNVSDFSSAFVEFFKSNMKSVAEKHKMNVSEYV